jgi:hypothetical protein
MTPDITRRRTMPRITIEIDISVTGKPGCASRMQDARSIDELNKMQRRRWKRLARTMSCGHRIEVMERDQQ